MPWLLDGNNLAQGGSRERVRQAALQLARGQRIRVVIVFDGAPPPGGGDVEQLGQVEVRYAPHADAAILGLLATTGGEGWRLATDDRELARRARERGVEVVSADTFWARVQPEPPDVRGNREPALQWQKELAYLRDPRNRLDPGPERVVRRRPRGRRGR